MRYKRAGTTCVYSVLLEKVPYHIVGHCQPLPSAFHKEKRFLKIDTFLNKALNNY